MKGGEKEMKKNLKLSLQAGVGFHLGDLAHPNRMPFSGLLTYFDIPSDKAVGGSKGKKVMIPSEFGIPSLASLKGMAVDFDPLMMDKHVAKYKIGVIEEAWAGESLLNGSVPVYVSGYVYAHDFPDEASDIKEFQSDLGFSYETINTPVMDGIYNSEPVLVVCGDIVFSGAAILLAEKAAYSQTSLAAQAEEEGKKEDIVLPIEEIIAKVMESIEAKYTLTAKAEEVIAEEVVVEPVIEEVVEPIAEPVIEEVVEPVIEPIVEEVIEPVVEEVVELQAEAVIEDAILADEVVVVEETVDFQAMAVDLQASLDALTAELADLKAEAIAVQEHTHKGFAYPTTLAAKFNFEANADSYEAQIATIDARTDLSSSEAVALKWELRAKELK